MNFLSKYNHFHERTINVKMSSAKSWPFHLGVEHLFLADIVQTRFSNVNNEYNFYIRFQISPKFVPESLIDNMSALVQVMA